ncbi:immunoglobulin-like domain-containing protein [Macrococcus animalis]|uniref:immunoglobulin-like domain-containing protein n=1 Tax=Macrococcus animalis TaxID=3395467 RepID=UPI0039BEA326
MKITRLYTTSIAAALLSTTILSGVAQAETTETPATTTTSPALTAEQTAAKAALDNLIKTAETIENSYINDAAMKYDPEFKAMRTELSLAKKTAAKTDLKVAEYEDAKKRLDDKLTPVIVKQEKRIAQDKLDAELTKAKAYKLVKENNYTSKPTKLQDALNKAITDADALFKSSKTTTGEFNKGLETLLSAKTAVANAPTVVKLAMDASTTVKFQTAEGRTQFPSSAGKLVTSGIVAPEDGTKYIEVNTLRDLSKYGLILPKGFEISNPDKPIASVSDFSKIELKQTPGHSFGEALVTYTLKRDGQVIDSAIPNFSVLQETGFENKYSEVMDLLSADQLSDIKKYYQKEGYIVDPTTTKYTFNKENFYQNAEINFIKKPAEAVVVDGPGMSSFNGYEFKAGQKYTLPKYVELYEEPNSNVQLDNRDFNIQVMSVTRAGSKTKLKVTDNKIAFPKVGKYTVKFVVRAKDGEKIRDYKGREKNYIYLSNTATVIDSAPVISGVKNATYNKKTFSYTKGIKAFDFVDNKAVKVTYKGKVSPSKKGKYKIYYYAKDSKGNVAKKTRYVVVK